MGQSINCACGERRFARSGLCRTLSGVAHRQPKRGGRTLTTTSSVTADVRAFFTTYCSAFIRQDAPAIARHFAGTIQVASDTGDDVTVHVATAGEWRKTIEHLLEMYRAINFGWAEAIALTCEIIS